MSLVQRKLTRSLNQTRGIFDKYLYKPNNGDTKQNILSAGYFAKARYASDPDWVGSIIEAEMADGYITVKVQSTNTVIIYDDAKAPINLKYIRAPGYFDNPARSDIQYVVDGQIDMNGTSIEVPAGGIYIKGFNFDVSGL